MNVQPWGVPMQVYDLAHYGMRGVVWLLAAALVAVAALIVLALRTPTFAASAEALDIGGTMFGRIIPAHALDLERARLVDLRQSPELAPKWRSFGVGLPGYRAGWFRLGSGERALVVLGRGSTALYIPTTAGYALLIAPDDAQGCLRSLRGGGA